MIIHRDSVDAGPLDLPLAPDDVRSMSPRRTSEDIETLGKAAREELQRYGFCCLAYATLGLTGTGTGMPKPCRTLFSSSSTVSRPSRKSTINSTTTTSFSKNTLGTS